MVEAMSPLFVRTVGYGLSSWVIGAKRRWLWVLGLSCTKTTISVWWLTPRFAAWLPDGGLAFPLTR